MVMTNNFGFINLLDPISFRSFVKADGEQEPRATCKPTELRKSVRAVAAEGLIDVWGPMGNWDYDMISRMIDTCESDKSVAEIILVLNTPGGSSCMCPEVAEQIRACKKTVHGFVSPMACSAGLWLGSACHHLHVPKSGWIGSLGTYMAHIDDSEMMKKWGLDIKYIKSPERKVYDKMPEASLKHYQEIIDGLTDDFVDAVAEYRGKTPDYVRKNFGQGEVLTGRQAVAVGMADDHLSLREYYAKRKDTAAESNQANARSRQRRRLSL